MAQKLLGALPQAKVASKLTCGKIVVCSRDGMTQIDAGEVLKDMSELILQRAKELSVVLPPGIEYEYIDTEVIDGVHVPTVK